VKWWRTSPATRSGLPVAQASSGRAAGRPRR
jgi:hypothetical protein